MSGLLHTLASITQVPFEAAVLSDTDEEDPPLPITSYACQWKAPRKRKESDARKHRNPNPFPVTFSKMSGRQLWSFPRNCGGRGSKSSIGSS